MDPKYRLYSAIVVTIIASIFVLLLRRLVDKYRPAKIDMSSA